MANISTSPHIRDENSPIETLALRALRRYGDMSPSTLDAEVILMFLDFGNTVLDDVMEHPYWQKGYTIPYYRHVSEARPIPDALMLAGLLAKHALDQASSKAAKYESDYYKRMNQLLMRAKFGVGATFELMGVDHHDATQVIRGVN